MGDENVEGEVDDDGVDLDEKKRIENVVKIKLTLNI